MAETTFELDQYVEYYSEKIWALIPEVYRTEDGIAMQPGTLIDYQIRLLGIPLNWRTRIESWEPPHRFSDVQLKGPYKLWHHTHEFVAVPEGTLMTDRVQYQMPSGPLGRLVHAVWTRRTLERIFDYRFEKIEELLGQSEAGAAVQW